jgi:hypothetical protein
VEANAGIFVKEYCERPDPRAAEFGCVARVEESVPAV